MNNYVFPFSQIPQGKKIVLYGAGNVGLCFYKQIKTTGYVEVVHWVDKNWENYKKQGYPTESLSVIFNNTKYDYLIIAVESAEIASQIKQDLIEKQVDEKKIIHFEKCRFVDCGLHENVFQEYKEMQYKDELIQINPKELLNKNRLDLIVRYLVAKDMKNGVKNNANLSLYSRMILCRNAAYEGKHYFSETTREGTKQYLDSIKELCDSIDKYGFQKDHFVPVGNNRVILNGAHRTATSLALEEKIWVKYYEDQSGNDNFGIEWFNTNGFNTDDKLRILRGYADLYDNCGIMLLLGPCMEQWDYLQAQLSKQMTIVGTVELDFTNNYIAYENLFREIYSDPLWGNVYIDRKVELLKMSPLKIRVILVSDEEHKEQNLYQTMCTAKLELRDRMYFYTDIAPVVMHGSDSKEEFVHLKQILLSVNNLRYLKLRTARNYRESFIKSLDKLRKLVRERYIPLDSVVICGSSGFEIFGLRYADDIDFIVESTYRKEYGEATISWAEKIDYTRKNSIEISDEKMYCDDLLISDDNFHYVFYGIKFVNLDIMAAKKKYNARKKDLRDVWLYELFKDYVANFDDIAYLKKQIENHFYLKR